MIIKERYVAVDNVCAWPNLTQLADGTLVATIFNQPTHGGWEGDVECWASEDGGRIWRLRGVPAPHEPRTNRMNVAAGCAADGALVVLASGWSNRNPPGSYSNPGEGEIIPAWVCRSEDGGKTWVRSEGIPTPGGAQSPAIPFGDIVLLAEGGLGVFAYSRTPQGGRCACFYTSADGGRSWAITGIIRDHSLSETMPLALPDGRLLAAGRISHDKHLELFESTDEGVSWNPSGPLTLPGQIPAHLLALRDGRILLSYGIRNQGLYGVGVRFSADGGKTWKAPRVLVNFETATDGGYPSTVESDDGTLVTAYYANRTPAHHRYHMGVVHWHPDE